jgi:hypothetical protein
MVVSTVWPVRQAAFEPKQVAAEQTMKQDETAGGAASCFLRGARQYRCFWRSGDRQVMRFSAQNKESARNDTANAAVQLLSR